MKNYKIMKRILCRLRFSAEFSAIFYAIILCLMISLSISSGFSDENAAPASKDISLSASSASSTTSASSSPSAASASSTASAPSQKEKVEINFWIGWSGYEFDVMQKIIDRFNASQDRIYCRLSTVMGVYQKVRISFAGGNVPDLLSCIWMEELAGYAVRGTLEPLDSYMKKSGRDFKSEYLPGLWNTLQYENTTYAMKLTANGNVYYYNKDIFEEVGWGADRVPKTIKELEELNELIKKTDENGNIIRYGVMPDDILLWGYIFGGGWFDEKTHSITANRPENIRALQWMKDQAKKYDSRKIQRFQKSFGGWINSTNCPFYIGKCAIYRSGEYMPYFMKRYAPQINWGWFPFPYPEGGKKNSTIVNSSVFAIPADSKHKDEAWELLNYLSSPEAVKEFCLGLHNLPPFTEAAKDPVFTNEDVYRGMIDIMSGENVFAVPMMPLASQYMQELTRIEEYAVYGDKDPKELLDGVQKLMEREYTRLMKQKGLGKDEHEKK